VNWLPLGGDEGDLAIKALASLAMAGFGAVIAISLFPKVTVKYAGLPKDRRLKIILTIILGTVIAIALQWVVIYTLTLGSISNEVRMLFFLSIVPLEELFFRLFIHNSGRYVVNLFRVTNPWVLSVGGTAFSATTFMLFHWQVYGQQPQFLWATFVLGVVLAFSYDYTGHLSVPVAIHFLINLLATQGVIYFIPPPV